MTPPFGTFPKKHPFWWVHPSLISGTEAKAVWDQENKDKLNAHEYINTSCETSWN